MTDKEDLIDKNNILTEQGRKLLKLSLQDEKESIRLFDLIRNEFEDSIENITKLYSVLPPLKTETKEDIEKSIDGLANFISISIPRIFSDFAFILDIDDIINSKNIENSKTIRELAEALTKSDKVRDDAIRTIIDRMEKDKENIQYDLKLHREDIKKLAESFSQDHQITKYLKREYKDKAKVADGNE